MTELTRRTFAQSLGAVAIAPAIAAEGSVLPFGPQTPFREHFKAFLSLAECAGRVFRDDAAGEVGPPASRPRAVVRREDVDLYLWRLSDLRCRATSFFAQPLANPGDAGLKCIFLHHLRYFDNAVPQAGLGPSIEVWARWVDRDFAKDDAMRIASASETRA